MPSALGLALTVTLATLSPDHRAASLVAAAPSAAHLLPAAALAQGAPSVRELEIDRELAGITEHLRSVKADWPMSMVLGAAFGFVVAGAIPFGMVMTLLGALVSPSILVLGVAVLALGVGGLILGIVCVVQGLRITEDAKVERTRLEARRRDLLREKDQLHQGPQNVPAPGGLYPPPPPGVERPALVPSLALVEVHF